MAEQLRSEGFRDLVHFQRGEPRFVAGVSLVGAAAALLVMKWRTPG